MTRLWGKYASKDCWLIKSSWGLTFVLAGDSHELSLIWAGNGGARAWRMRPGLWLSPGLYQPSARFHDKSDIGQFSSVLVHVIQSHWLQKIVLIFSGNLVFAFGWAANITVWLLTILSVIRPETKIQGLSTNTADGWVRDMFAWSPKGPSLSILKTWLEP